jgi:hypothetical protein
MGGMTFVRGNDQTYTGAMDLRNPVHRLLIRLAAIPVVLVIVFAAGPIKKAWYGFSSPCAKALHVDGREGYSYDGKYSCSRDWIVDGKSLKLDIDSYQRADLLEEQARGYGGIIERTPDGFVARNVRILATSAPDTWVVLDRPNGSVRLSLEGGDASARLLGYAKQVDMKRVDDFLADR